jgi:FKBP-type peptidyl-prolyl cis-trans isomerase
LRARAIALLATAALGLGACGDDDEKDTDLPAAVPATQTTPAAPTATTAAAGGTPTAAAKAAGISTDMSSKPKIPKPKGKEPKKLVVTDIVKGKGDEAKSGDNIVVHYVGVLFSNGEQFDASWDNGQPFPFTLGQGDVIPGWDQGVEGMRVGGRRLLTIPPDLAYGAQGQGSIPANATLVFAVDLLNVTKG